jgi:hypothetical protein
LQHVFFLCSLLCAPFWLPYFFCSPLLTFLSHHLLTCAIFKQLPWCKKQVKRSQAKCHRMAKGSGTHRKSLGFDSWLIYIIFGSAAHTDGTVPS